MRLPLPWLLDYLNLNAAEVPGVLEMACRRWELEPATDPARSFASLFTFAGFNCDGVEGTGLDAALELDVLANRPDAQCVLGLAREAAAFLNVKMKLPSELETRELSLLQEELDGARVMVEEHQLCPRYTARLIRGVRVAPSPEWLQARLKSMGLTPRNNIVDITNFILFELNQPLHAFDLSKLAGKRISVRRARDQEAFKPLYGEIPPLTSETLVIADAERPVAIAGIIGGAGSEVDASTRDILLEAACFDPANTRRTCRRLKVGTDSSYRFERGVDLEGLERASARAARLIAELAGGTVSAGLLEARALKPETPACITLRMNRLAGIYGVATAPEEARRILETLGCRVSENGADLQVEPPTWRRGDLKREIDLIEEVARLRGYHQVPTATRMPARVPPRLNLERTLDATRAHGTAQGYHECVTDSLIDPRWPMPAVWTQAAPLKMDPRSVLREDHSALRTSLLPSLLSVAKLNQDRRSGTSRLFECGKVFLPRASPDKKSLAPPEERPVLGLLDELGFRHLAEAVHGLGRALSLENAHVKLSPALETPAFLEPGTACRVFEVREAPGEAEAASAHSKRIETPLGWAGVLSARLTADCGLKNAPALAELNLAALAKVPQAPARYHPLPNQPEVVRDIALVVDEGVTWHALEHFAQAAQEPLRDKHEAPRFLSVYRGKQTGPGKKSVAFSLVYRGRERSLTDEEVNAAHQRFVDALLKQFNATLRM